MTQLEKTGRVIFAIGILVLAFLGILVKDFIVGRPPVWPAGFMVNASISYIANALLALAAIMILVKRKAGAAALLIALLILLFSISRCLPHFMNNWLNAYKAIALFGGALIIACSVYQKEGGDVPRFMVSENTRANIITGGCVCIASFFISGGYAHFKFAGFVNGFIPAYIPFHPFWTYFCGVCLIAGGLGVVIPQTRRLAALLSGIMVAGWFVLLHIPRFIADTSNASDRMGLCESFTFAGIFFVLTAISPKKAA